MPKVGQRFVPYRMFVGSFIPNALMSYKGITATAKLCWARLAQYAGKEGRCFPSQETLANEIGVSKRQVVRILLELEQMAFIRREAPKGRDKLKQSTKYFFLWHHCFEEDDNLTLRSDIHDTTVVTSMTLRSDVDGTLRESYTRESIEENQKEREPEGSLSQKAEALATDKGRHSATLGRKAPAARPPKNHGEVEMPSLKEILEKNSKEKVAKEHRDRKAGKITGTAGLVNFWKSCLSSYGYSDRIALTAKERGMLKNLSKQLEGISASEFIEYAVANWKLLRNRITWGEGKKSKIPENPSFMEAYFQKAEIVHLMSKGITADTPKPKEEYITYTNPAEVPKDRPDHDVLVNIIKKQGQVRIRR